MDPAVLQELSTIGSQEELIHTMRRKLIRVGTDAETEKWLASLHQNAEQQRHGTPGVIPVLIGPNLCAFAVDASARPTLPPEIAQTQYKMMNTMNGIMFEVQEILDRIKHRDSLLQKQSAKPQAKSGPSPNTTTMKSSPVFKQEPRSPSGMTKTMAMAPKPIPRAKSQAGMTMPMTPKSTPKPKPKSTGIPKNNDYHDALTKTPSPTPNCKPGRTPPVKRLRSGTGLDNNNPFGGSPSPNPMTSNMNMTPRKIRVRHNIQFFKDDEPMDVDN